MSSSKKNSIVRICKVKGGVHLLKKKKTWIYVICGVFIVMIVVFLLYSNRSNVYKYDTKDLTEQHGASYVEYLDVKEKDRVKVYPNQQEKLFELVNMNREEKEVGSLEPNSTIQKVAYLSNINVLTAELEGKREYEKNGHDILKGEGFLNSHHIILEQHTIKSKKELKESELMNKVKGKLSKFDLMENPKLEDIAISILKHEKSNYYISIVYSYN